MRWSLLVVLLIVAVSCRQEPLLNLNPFEPNEGVFRRDVEKLGFELNSAEDGLCVYRKSIDSLDIYFLMDFEDDCTKVKLQGFSFPFGTFSIQSKDDSIKLSRNELPMDIVADSLIVARIVSGFGARITSSRLGAWPTYCRYEATNVKTEKIFSVAIHYGTDLKKHLSIEYE